VSNATKRVRQVWGGTYVLTIDPPVGRKQLIWSREQEVFEQDVPVDMVPELLKAEAFDDTGVRVPRFVLVESESQPTEPAVVAASAGETQTAGLTRADRRKGGQ